MRALVRRCSCIAAAVGAVLVTPLLIWLAIRLDLESSPSARGAEQAYMQNCIDCHGRADAQGVADENLICPAHATSDVGSHYRGKCRDLLAHFEIVRLNRNFTLRASTTPVNRLLQGESLARRYGCFQCHGDLGQGGLRNEGALKGYIPGYFGSDFSALTRGASTESINAWIRHGADPALVDSGVSGYFARFFLERQAVRMPRFESLPESEIQHIAEYVIALHHYGEMDANDVRDYSRRSVSQSLISVANRESAPLPHAIRGLPIRQIN